MDKNTNLFAWSNRVHITTAEEFRAYLDRDFVDMFTGYVIHAGVHPNIFKAIQYFSGVWDYSNEFIEQDGSVVTISRPELSIVAILNRADVDHQLTILPTDYIHYKIQVEHFTQDDVSVIEQWKWAHEIELLASLVPNNDVLDRIREVAKARHVTLKVDGNVIELPDKDKDAIIEARPKKYPVCAGSSPSKGKIIF